MIGGAVFIVANPGAGLGPALLLVIAVVFGCTASVSTSLLFTQRIVRPIVTLGVCRDTGAHLWCPGRRSPSSGERRAFAVGSRPVLPVRGIRNK